MSSVHLLVLSLPTQLFLNRFIVPETYTNKCLCSTYTKPQNHWNRFRDLDYTYYLTRIADIRYYNRLVIYLLNPVEYSLEIVTVNTI